jgi:hypothetical protein
MIPGLGTLTVDNISGIYGVQFRKLLGVNVLKMPIRPGEALEKCNLPCGSYIMNFYGKERLNHVLIKCW